MWKFSLQWLSGGLSYEKYALKPKLEVLLVTFLLVLVITKLQKVVRHLIKLAKIVMTCQYLAKTRAYKSSTTLDVTEMWLHLKQFFCQITQGQISKNQDRKVAIQSEPKTDIFPRKMVKKPLFQ